MPEKLIHNATGTVQMLYESPSFQQGQEVSKVLVQGSSEKENAPKSGNVPVRALPMKPMSSDSIFSNIVATITISPQNLSIDVCNQQTNPDVDGLLRGIDLETFTS